MLKSEVNDKTKKTLIQSWDEVLSLNLISNESDKNIDTNYIEQKIKERAIAKENKDYTLADNIRKELLEKGILLKDTREGTTYTLNT